MSDKKRLSNKLRRDAERLIEMAEAVEQLLPDDLPTEARLSAISECLFIAIPFDWGVYAGVRQVMDKSPTRWESSSNPMFDSADGVHTRVFHYNGTSLHIQLRPEMQGAQCNLVQIGTKEIPIYRAVCG